MVVSYSPAGVQAPNTTNLCDNTTACYVTEDTFDNGTSSDFQYLVDTGVTGSIDSSYTGAYTIPAANEYGGAGGTGHFIDVTDNSYTLTFSTTGDIPGVDYFGLWFSALDGGNELTFYNGTTVLYTFNAQSFISLVGACSGSNPFCGNPNNRTEDSGEQFAFLNFFYEGAGPGDYITSIKFTETTSAGFESDNHTEAYLNPPNPSGTVFEGAPEPGSMTLLGIGAAVVIGLKRRSIRGC